MFRGGGVQWCTHDYLNSLRDAGFDCEIAGYASDKGLVTRLRRKLFPLPFGYEFPPNFVSQIINKCNAKNVKWLFLNNIGGLSIAPLVRSSLAKTKIVFLSHGAQSTDHVNMLRLCPELLPRLQRKKNWIGRLLLEEIHQRKCIDYVTCISEEDTIFEKWLGATKTIFIPRSIRPRALTMNPQQFRVGTVSTLDHGPNLDGIRQLAQCLSRYPAVKLRIVGRPESMGHQLQRQYSCIEYLGGLSDADLESEASSWCAFVNPIFCQARGASTKVATALGWGLPVLTTHVGARGYRWDDSLIPRCENADQLAALTHDVSSCKTLVWRDRATGIRSLAPSIHDAGQLIRRFLVDE